jgi:hypothetical protein
MAIDITDLAALGWSSHSQSQLSADDLKRFTPARVLAVHRSGLEVAAGGTAERVPQFVGGDDEEDRRPSAIGCCLTRQRVFPAGC